MPTLRICYLLSIFLATICFAPVVWAEESVSLFDGKTLKGWDVLTCEAVVKDSAILLTAGNGLVQSKKQYSDFVLEYEYKCDNRLNSGVQIRSTAYNKEVTKTLENGKTKKFPAGRVHGYQVEIDPNKPDRMWSAGIYDEGRRGWLYPGLRGGNDGEAKAAFTKSGQKIYKPNEWNKVRVECNGDSIKTWLNGVVRADFKDSLTAKGFIALQVHGIGNKKELVGAQVQWRNLRLKVLK